jgi:hypothetical protein
MSIYMKGFQFMLLRNSMMDWSDLIFYSLVVGGVMSLISGK